MLRSSLLRSLSHKATCQSCKQFANFTSQRTIPSNELPPILAVNTAVYNDDNLDFWLDSKGNTFLKPRIQIAGLIGDMDDPLSVWYEIRVSKYFLPSFAIL